MTRKTIAIIVAAGRGNRFGGDLPKQFCPLAGRPMLMTTIDRFVEAIGFEDIVIVLDTTMMRTWTKMCDRHGFRSPAIVAGGTTRWESVGNAINAIAPDADADTVVMVHDGARPLATASLLKRMSHLDSDADGMIPATPPVESLRELIPGDAESRAVDRSRYVSVQTPQSFRLSTLREAYAQPFRKEFTDDASVVESAGFKRIIIEKGEPTNIKITNPLDMTIAEAILKRQQEGLA